MINSPESSVEFTDVQTRQLATFEARLKNVDDETVAAYKNLTALKQYVEQTTSELEYKKGLLAELEASIEIAQTKKTRIDNELAEGINVLNNTRTESIALTQIHAATGIELTNRESVLRLNEAKHLENVEAFNQDSIKLAKEKEDVMKVKENFTKVTKDIPWI